MSTKYHINIKIKTLKLLKTFVSHVFSFQSFAFIVQEFLCFMVRWYNYAKEIIILKKCRNFHKNFRENNCTKSTVTDKINRQIKININHTIPLSTINHKLQQSPHCNDDNNFLIN